MSARRCYEFGPFRLDPAERRLLWAGKPTSLTPKAFDLLVLLVENQGRLIVKDEIMQAVWRGSFVEDASLTVLISALRKVLGEKEAAVKYIETVPKKGYRFTASVKVIAASQSNLTFFEDGGPEFTGLMPAESSLAGPFEPDSGEPQIAQRTVMRVTSQQRSSLVPCVARSILRPFCASSSVVLSRSPAWPSLHGMAPAES